jgi:hypothetical protein
MINKDPLDYNTSIAPILKDLATPLLKNFNITTFSYLKFLKNGQMMHISNQEKWLQHYIKTELYDDADRYSREIGMVQKREKSYFLRVSTTNHSFEKIMNDFGLCYGISIYQEFDDYIEMFGFATDTNHSSIIEMYINNIEFLKRFSVFFKDIGKELIDHNNKNRLITPNTSPKWITSHLPQIEKQSYLSNTTARHFPISETSFLCLREAQALYYRLRGDTMKDIARKMAISPRTVETYIEKVKIKGEGILSSSTNMPLNLSQKNYIENIISYFECEER